MSLILVDLLFYQISTTSSSIITQFKYTMAALLSDTFSIYVKGLEKEVHSLRSVTNINALKQKSLPKQGKYK